MADGEIEAKREHRIVKTTEKPKDQFWCSVLLDPLYLVYEGADADRASLDEIQAGLVVLVIDK